MTGGKKMQKVMHSSIQGQASESIKKEETQIQ